MKKYTFIITILFFCCSNIAIAQTPTAGVLWVVPNHESALPIDNTDTGSEALNYIFKEFHVKAYYLLDSVKTYSGQNVYEIVLEKDFAYLEYYLEVMLKNMLIDITPLFQTTCRPAIFFQNLPDKFYGYIRLDPPFDSSLPPCSSTPFSSCNEEFNTILDSYDASYIYFITWDHYDKIEHIVLHCEFSSIHSLYHALLPYKNLWGCLSLCIGQTFTCNPLNVKNIEENTVTVFPNPAYDYFTISGIFPQKVTLYDWQGKEVFTKTDRSNKIDVSHLQRGLYFLYIISDTGTTSVQKIIKE